MKLKWTLLTLVAASLGLSLLLELVTTGFAGGRAPSAATVLVRGGVYALVPLVAALPVTQTYRVILKRPPPSLATLVWNVWFLFAGFSAYRLLAG
ncbi:MAG: hypothetical protein ACYDA8_11875 [Deferrisomatales bacterium]